MDKHQRHERLGIGMVISQSYLHDNQIASFVIV